MRSRHGPGRSVAWTRMGAALAFAWLMLGCGESPPPGSAGASGGLPSRQAPNLLFIFVDDLGYGDLGSYGSKNIATPHLDRIAREGVRFTQFYSGSSVCTPSRAALLTGRYAARQVLGPRALLYPGSTAGMAPEQITIAEILRDAGYATALIGKWHLGHHPEMLPTEQGFDYFFGLPYSNDMQPLPLMRNGETLRVLADVAAQRDLTPAYTREVESFMRRAKRQGRPFFVYYASSSPHVPLAASQAFADKSPSCDELGLKRGCGRYADVVQELDWSVGKLMAALQTLDLADNTLVFFTSDNGPWRTKGRNAGSAGPLRGGKGSTFEGGFRVPMLAWGPGRIRSGHVEVSPALMVDWLPTLAAYAGAQLPGDRTFDGRDLRALLAGKGPRQPAGVPFRSIYYRADNATPGAYREGRWKYKAAVSQGEAAWNAYQHEELLFDLSSDPGEKANLAAEYPERVAQLRARMLALDGELKADPHR